MCDFSKLKLCFLAGTLEHGGAERQLFYILQALGRAGAALRVLAFDEGEVWEQRILELGVPVTCVGIRRSKLARLLRIVKELKKQRPAALQSQHFYTNAYAGVAAGMLGCAGIGAMRSNGRAEVAQSGAWGGRLNLHLPRVLAANSKCALHYAQAQGVPAGRLCLLPNVVDMDCFKPAEAPAGGPITLLASGRLAREKRFDRFVSLIGRLRQLRLDVRGMIVGPRDRSEDLRPELEQQARRLGLLPDGLLFQDGASDMRPFYRAAAACVLTSDFEGTPNVLLEAMACGLPVLTTRVGGVPDIVQQAKTGFLVDADDLDGLTSRAADLVRSAGLRHEMGTRARLFVEENHSLQRLPFYLGKLYERALPRPPQRAAAPLPIASH